jgi:hypothetical protein
MINLYTSRKCLGNKKLADVDLYFRRGALEDKHFDATITFEEGQRLKNVLNWGVFREFGHGKSDLTSMHFLFKLALSFKHSKLKGNKYVFNFTKYKDEELEVALEVADKFDACILLTRLDKRLKNCNQEIRLNEGRTYENGGRLFESFGKGTLAAGVKDGSLNELDVLYVSKGNDLYNLELDRHKVNVILFSHSVKLGLFKEAVQGCQQRNTSNVGSITLVNHENYDMFMSKERDNEHRVRVVDCTSLNLYDCMTDGFKGLSVYIDDACEIEGKAYSNSLLHVKKINYSLGGDFINWTIDYKF